jgi:crossover junction endodeoxyribonuclease RuvC
VIAAIDPGKTGAIAMLYPVDGRLFIEDMPVFDKDLNGAAIAAIFKEFTPDHVYLESVNSHLMGRQSAFNFGQGFGVIKGVLATLAIPFTLVTPSKWKGHYSLGRDKNAAREAATRLFPANAELFQRKKDDGRAEAALIALWGKEQGIIR